MDLWLAEFIGTAILVLLGNGVVANVVLERTKGHGGGWIVVAAGWGCAVYTAVVCVGEISGAHLNPAVSLGLAAAGKFPWEQVPLFVSAQMAGGFAGAVLVFLFYYPHYGVTDDADGKLATFCNAPAIRAPLFNLFGEVVATFVLVYAVLMFVDPQLTLPTAATAAINAGDVKVGLGTIGAVRVGLIVFAIGLCLGGTTGYAINPARDFAPRLAHALLPVPGKRDSDWPYSWIPVLGPLAGGLLAALLAGVK
jgi:glycerol uptake facilitator protein